MRMGRNEKRDGICYDKLQDRDTHCTSDAKFMFYICNFISMRKKKKRPLEAPSKAIDDNENDDFLLLVFFFPPSII